MEEKSILPHKYYYFFELIVLFTGFFLVSFFNEQFFFQFLLMIFILGCYTIMGFIHHKIHHDLEKAIMVEYVLVSFLVLAAFIFLNAGRI